ncbi:MAG: lasso peptide biosynthesis PqqD family chaperone [Clostridium sp.]|nr:lasso peptide biosynthesis PqqD family chaperone [Clostridium sp.]
MSLEFSSVIVQKVGLDTTDLDGEVVMMDMDRGKYYNFNAVGSRIWKFIEEPIPIKEVIDRLLSEFDIDENKCGTSVMEFVKKLKADDLIEIF